MCESRRQSNAAAQRSTDFDGTHSLYGSVTGHNLRDSSPFITRHRKLDHTPLYINNNESESISDVIEDLKKDGINGNDDLKRQVAMVGPMMRPRHVLNSINSSSEEIGESNKEIFKFPVFELKFHFENQIFHILN